MLRRNSLSFSWKLIIPPTNPTSSLFSRTSSSSSSSILTHIKSTSSSVTSTSDTENLGFRVADRVRSFGSAAAIDNTTSLAPAVTAIDVVRHYGRCYWELSKARLSMLVVATSGAGYVLGSGSAIDYLGLSCTCAGTMMVTAAANSLNQIFEIKNDAKMKRTMRRPLPSGRITLPYAVMWASSVSVAGTALLAWKANMLAWSRSL